MVIKILDHIKTASTYEDGEVLYRLILPKVLAGEKVEVDFAGITSTPSAFINAAFVRLLEHVSFDHIKRTLSFTNSTRQINQLILSRFNFVANQEGQADLDG